MSSLPSVDESASVYAVRAMVLWAYYFLVQAARRVIQGLGSLDSVQAGELFRTDNPTHAALSNIYYPWLVLPMPLNELVQHALSEEDKHNLAQTWQEAPGAKL